MTKTKAMFSLTCASIIVGTTLVVSRLISEGASIYCLQFFSMILASTILYFWIGPSKTRHYLKTIGRKDLIYLALQTLTGVVLFRILIIYGVKMTRAMDAGIILSLTPICTVILALIFLNERLGKKEWIAVLCAFIGVLIINIAGVSETQGEGGLRLVGNVMVLIATLVEAAFTIFSKKVSTSIPALVKSFLLCVFAVLFFAPFAIVELYNDSSFLLNSDFWLLIAYTGIVLTVGAYILWFRGIDYVSGVVAGVFNTLIPVSSILMLAVIFSERMSGIQVIGLGFVLSGVGLIMLPFKDSQHELAVSE